ncbi:response regulator [bacterium]|nr:response regulator [bacterium]
MSDYTEKSVLVVDDNKVVRTIVGKYLADMKFKEISFATNATEALTLLKQNHVDLLLTDIHMPMVNGLTLLKTIRNTAKFKELPVLIISSENGLDYIKTAMSRKVSGYLVKPIQATDLKSKIDTIFNK